MTTRCNSRPSRLPAVGVLAGHVIWVDARQIIPDDEITVLIALSDGEVWTGFHETGEWRMVDAEPVRRRRGVRVTHWAELPEHPSQATR